MSKSYTQGLRLTPALFRVYVEDLIMTGEDPVKIFKQEIIGKLEISDLRLLMYYLGIKVVQEDCGTSRLLVPIRYLLNLACLIVTPPRFTWRRELA